MKEINLEELKRIQIDILDTVHTYCEQNGISYFISSGTLIGAVRHKGYIPWDDDIDLYMPRKDFESFIRTFNCFSPDYFVSSLVSSPLYNFAYAKVERKGTKLIENVDSAAPIGVNIDVFPLDGVPDDEKDRIELFHRVEKLRRKQIIKQVRVDFKRRGLLKNMVLLLGKIALFYKSVRELATQIDNTIDKNNSNSKYVCNLVMGNGIRSVFHRSATDGTTDVEFEGKKYKTMKGYHEYLTQTYGDYMQLPPEEERVSHHSFKAYWV